MDSNRSGHIENESADAAAQPPPPFGHAQQHRPSNSGSRQSSLSADTEEGEEAIRVLGAPLSDRSSEMGEGERPTKTLVDARGQNVVEEEEEMMEMEKEMERKEEDSLRDFEEQEREVARQLAMEEAGNGGEGNEGEGEGEEEGDLMEDILEENEDEEEEEEEEEKRKGEMMGLIGVDGEEEEENDGMEGPSSSNQGGGLWRVEADELPRSSQSRVSESLQNREFTGAGILREDSSELKRRLGSADSGAADNSVAGYPLDYPSDPPPAYTSPRALSRGRLFERPATSTQFSHKMMSSNAIAPNEEENAEEEAEEEEEEENERMERIQPGFAVPSPRFDGPEEEGDESELEEGDPNSQGGEDSGKIRAAIGSSFALAGGMAAAVAATARIGGSENVASPKQLQGIVGQSPRGGGAIGESPRILVQGARTAADLGKREALGKRMDSARSSAGKQRKEAAEGDGANQQRYPVSAELKAMFKQIEDYVAERVEIEPVFRPFQIDYIPAVGDVDPFIKVPVPEENDELQLGLAVLDEPAAAQSDPAIVDLRLHQMAGKTGAADVPVKKLSRADKNAHQIDRWVQSVRELRRTKPPDRVNYSRPMPSIETLMQEWPQGIEQQLKGMKLLLNANLDAALEDYVDICLAIADIPMHKSRLEALHLFFSLYAEFQNSQHFRNLALGQSGERGETAQTMVDNFVLEEGGFGGGGGGGEGNRLEIG